jgi:hypothetical protein
MPRRSKSTAAAFNAVKPSDFELFDDLEEEEEPLFGHSAPPPPKKARKQADAADLESFLEEEQRGGSGSQRSFVGFRD